MRLSLHARRCIAAETASRPTAVFVVTDYVPATGGTTTQTRLEALELLRRDWTVEVVTRRHSPDWHERETLEGVAIRRVGKGGHTKSSKAHDLPRVWWYLLKAGRLEAVQVMMDIDYAVAAVLAGRGHQTYIMWATEGDAPHSLSGARGVVRRCITRNCRHVVLTGRMQSELADDCGIHDSSLIPVPVDCDRFRPPTEEERQEQRGLLNITAPTVIAFSGHLIERKGVDLLFSAFHEMVKEGADLHLLFLGSGEEREGNLEPQLRAAAIELGIQTLITFDAVQDVAPYLRAADIFCLPSWREGMPNSILEAMATGLACVAPISAGGGDLLRGGAGIIPPSNSPADLIEAIRPLIHNSERRNTLGRAARLQAEAYHGVVPVIDAYQLLWRGGTAGEVPPSPEPLNTRRAAQPGSER